MLGANRAVVIFDAPDITTVLGVELPYSDVVKWNITPAIAAADLMPLLDKMLKK